ncbi:MAG TPA: hypothetical protein VHH11_13845 [Gammaproteobacteria bacterium]|nr:hypothetical protein [Gammaproteobacteria bacterium]
MARAQRGTKKPAQSFKPGAPREAFASTPQQRAETLDRLARHPFQQPYEAPSISDGERAVIVDALRRDTIAALAMMSPYSGAEAAERVRAGAYWERLGDQFPTVHFDKMEPALHASDGFGISRAIAADYLQNIMSALSRCDANDGLAWVAHVLSFALPAALEAAAALAARADLSTERATTLLQVRGLVANALARRILLDELHRHHWNLSAVQRRLGFSSASNLLRAFDELELVDEYKRIKAEKKNAAGVPKAAHRALQDRARRAGR